MTDNINVERKIIYDDYRAAKKALRRGRDFDDWMKIARGYAAARTEAMQRAKTNVPHGTAYREELVKVANREKLFDHEIDGRKFPSPEDCNYCIKVLDNYEMSQDPRRKSIKAWRDHLSASDRAKLNHPKSVWSAYQSKTEPAVEKEAKQRARELKQGEKPKDPMLEKVGESEAAEHIARRETEEWRELVRYILDHVSLPDDIAAKIKTKLQE
jgi:hypothetical protein